MSVKRLVLHCVSVLMLLSQQAALTHATWHAGHDAALPQEHQRTARSIPTAPERLLAICASDAVMGQLLATGAARSGWNPFAPSAAQRKDCGKPVYLATSLLQPPSRGPPALL